MKKYLVLYRSESAANGMSVSEMFANTPPEQMEAGMAMWKSWSEKCGDAIVDMGSPLDNSTVLTGDESATIKSTITGFSMLQAASIEEATDLMKGHPHFFAPGASVQILEFACMPGM